MRMAVATGASERGIYNPPASLPEPRLHGQALDSAM